MKIVSKRLGTVIDVADWFGLRKVASGRYEGGGRLPDLPSKSDVKSVWVDRAVAQGMDRSEAESATKADLMARFGS